MPSKDFHFDLATARFVKGNDPRIGERETKLNEAEIYSGSLFVYSGDSLVTGESLYLSLNDPTNAIALVEAVISGSSYSLNVSGLAVRAVLEGKATANCLLSAEIDGLDIQPLAAPVTANPYFSASLSLIEAHLENFDNPHNVTKAQLGLENVDNTSDANKPISTATQAALNGLSGIMSSGGQVFWENVLEKPTEFEPVSHSHNWQDIQNFPSGLFYGSDNPSGFITGLNTGHLATKTDLEATGQNLAVQIEGLSEIFYLKNNPSGFITGVDLSPYVEKANTGQFQPIGEYYLNSNPSGFITGLNTGDFLTAIPLDVVRTTGIQYINGNKFFGSMMVASGGVYLPGVTNQYTLDSNGFFEYGELEGFLIDFPNRILKGTAFAPVALDWRNLILSGNWQTNTSPTTSGHIINKGYFDDSRRRFVSGIQTGVETQWMSFSPVFSSAPYVQITLQNRATGAFANQYFNTFVSGAVTTSGFFAAYSSPAPATGYSLQVFADI